MNLRMKFRHFLAGVFLVLPILGMADTECPIDPLVTLGASPQVLAEEQNAFQQVNLERIAEGLSSLTMRNDLRLVARQHSEDMVARDFFSHNNPDGETPFDRLAAAGITYSTAGENIAKNNFPDPVTTAVEGWMDSQGHRENILREAFTHTGMGVAIDADGNHFFTQVFMAESTSKTGEESVIYYTTA